MGQIDPDGVLHGAEHLKGVLDEIGNDPVAAARRYGYETKRCCCCGTELEDPVSVFSGIGPVCLERLAGKEALKEMAAAFKAQQIGQGNALVGVA